MNLSYREIKSSDNIFLEQIIKRSLEEHDMAVDGTVYTDPVIKSLSNHFNGDRKRYFVAELEGKIVGGAGIAPLPGEKENVCELQRMFLDNAYRGKGIGYSLLKRCIDYAKETGFIYCYLESSEKLKAALNLYEKFGFKYLKGSMGNTGHFSCTTYMGMKI